MKPSRLLSAFFLIVVVGLPIATAQAATYYLSATGTDSGTCTTGARCKTLDFVWTLASAGANTVILGDGNYNYAGMEFDQNIDNGTDWTNYLTIKAENDDGVVVTLLNALSLDGDENWYAQIEGINFDYPGEKSMRGRQLKFLRCGFKGGETTGNVTNTTLGSGSSVTSHFLFEDCFWIGRATGSARYQLLVYRAENIIIRRGVSWMGDGWDDGGSTNPSANLVIYNSSHVYVQNFIILDSTDTPDTYNGSFYVVNNSGQSYIGDKLFVNGYLAVNNTSYGIRYDNLGEAHSSSTWRNVSVVDSAEGGAALGYSLAANVTMDGFSLIQASHVRTGTDIVGMQEGNAGTSIAKNGIIANWEDDSMSGTFTSSYIDCYNNGGTCDGGTGQTTVNPRTSGLTYHHRIETGSTLATAGSGGGRLGPNMTTKIGTSGTLVGDSGYNTDTGAALWPWPYESRIKGHLRSAYSTHGFGAAAYASKTFTEYVLGYGNAPSGTYDVGTPTGTPPADISTVTVSAGRMGIFAVNLNLYASEATWNLEVSSVSGMGLELFRSNWDTWDEVETASGTFTFTELQSRLNLVRNNGMRVMYTLPYRPNWSPSVGCPVINPFFGLVNLSTTHCAVADLGVYDRFVSTIAYTFCEEIDEWEIPGNEPDFLFGSTNTEVAVRLTTHAISNITRVCPGAEMTIGAVAHPLRTMLAGGLTAAATTYTDHHWFPDYLTKLKLALPSTLTLSSFTYSMHVYYDADQGNATLQKQISSMTVMLQNQGVTNPVLNISEVGKFGGSYTTSDKEAEEVGKSSFTYRAYAMAMSPNSLWPNTVVKSIIFHNFAGYDFSATTTSYAARYSYFTLKKLATLDGYTAQGDQDADANEAIYKFTSGGNTKYVAWTEAGTAQFNPGGTYSVTDVYGTTTTDQSGAITLTTAPKFIEVSQSGLSGFQTIRGLTIRGFQ